MPTTRPIAYLTAQYPAVSHTFILREVEALRAQGIDVRTCSIRRTPSKQHKGPSEKAAAASTFYVLDKARKPLKLLTAQLDGLRNPTRYFGALALAWRTSAPGWRARLYQLIYFLEATVVAQHLKAKNVGHIHNHFANASASVGMLAAHLVDIPFSFTLHGPSDLTNPGYWRLDEKVKRARFVSCISHFARSQAMLHSDPDYWHKLYIIHCGVLPQMYNLPAPLEQKQGLSLVFVGRWAAVKGLRVLIDGVKKARDRIDNLTITLIGDGDERAWLEQQPEVKEGVIELAGYKSQAEVAGILAEKDALILPSFAEGVPVVLMEAMASGKPVLATQVGGVSELVDDGISGYLVSPGNVEALVDRMVALSQQSDRVKMGLAGRAKVVEEFDVTKEAARLKTLFDGYEGADVRPPMCEK